MIKEVRTKSKVNTQYRIKSFNENKTCVNKCSPVRFQTVKIVCFSLKRKRERDLAKYKKRYMRDRQ